MQIRYLDPKSAEKLMTENNNSKELLENTNLSSDYKELRQKLRVIRTRILGLESAQKGYSFDYKKYDFDLEFGLEMYRLFLDDYGDLFSIRVFSNNSFWIYLSVAVIPDIVAERWGENNSVRSYKTPRRIWLSTLWWYIHLSWQGDYETTFKILKENSTDHILNLVERANRGYDLQLYRTVMYYYSKLDNDFKVMNGRKTFRSILVLNTAFIQTMEPMLVKNSYHGYVLYLFENLGLLYEDGKFKRRI